MYCSNVGGGFGELMQRSLTRKVHELVMVQAKGSKFLLLFSLLEYAIHTDELHMV